MAQPDDGRHKTSMNNPFTLNFGILPQKMISRPLQRNSVIETFTSVQPSYHVVMITGVRGSGKTVMMTEIAKTIAEIKDWIVIELNPEKNLLHSLAARLYNISSLKPLFINAKIEISVMGVGFSIDSTPVLDDEVLVDKMLTVLKKHKKRLLVAVDEAVNNPYIREFSYSFQILLRHDYDLFLLMTGLYENIYELQNEKTLTFLYRAPKMELESLDLNMIADTYKGVFDLSEIEAAKMAKLTNGYPFAFQVLGYLRWERGASSAEDLLPEYDHYLADYVYDKVWHEMTDREKQITACMGNRDEFLKIKDVRESAGLESNLFSVYREKLKRKGLIDVSRYGFIKLALPRFGVFAEKKMLYSNL